MTTSSIPDFDTDPPSDFDADAAKDAILALKRDLTPYEVAVIHKLYAQKAGHEPAHAYVTTVQELTLRKWNGKHPPETNMNPTVIPAGTTLKIVMVSRFGDCGLTDDLKADHGYHIRIEFDDPAITNIRETP